MSAVHAFMSPRDTAVQASALSEPQGADASDFVAVSTAPASAPVSADTQLERAINAVEEAKRATSTVHREVGAISMAIVALLGDDLSAVSRPRLAAVRVLAEQTLWDRAMEIDGWIGNFLSEVRLAVSGSAHRPNSIGDDRIAEALEAIEEAKLATSAMYREVDAMALAIVALLGAERSIPSSARLAAVRTLTDQSFSDAAVEIDVWIGNALSEILAALKGGAA
jgi:hypothetical protein